MVVVYKERQALYLEFVPGGDLWNELERRMLAPRPQEYFEVELWRMFLCFAKAMAAMGMTDENKDWWPILHLDFKPDNSKLLAQKLTKRNGDNIRLLVLDW